MYFCRTSFLMATSAHPLNSNDQYILFLLLKLLHAVAEFYQINQRKARKKAYGLIFLDGKTRYYKDKVAS